MSGSSGIGQLAKGVVIGIVLILAIVGTMSIFDQAKNKQSPLGFNNKTESQTSIDTATVDKKPEITIVQSNHNNASEEKSQTLEEKQTELQTTKEKTSPESEDNQKITEKNKGFTPILENERVLKEKPIKRKYGLLHLSAINPNNRTELLVDFVVLNQSGKKIAEEKQVKNASFRLPVGKYTVITTLKKPAGSRRSRAIQRTKKIRISANKKTSRVFKLEPPTTLGVLQVSAKSAKNGKTLKANYIIQNEKGKTIATRTNVTHTLFKLKAGSYKVIVKSGNQSDFRTLIVEPGESTKETFTLQETLQQGKLLVRILDIKSSKPIRANIIITTSNGTPIQQLKEVSQTELSLITGKYKIRVTAPNGQSSKNITISAGQKLNEVFRFNTPQKNPAKEVQITENVKITATRPIARTPSISQILKKEEAKRPKPKTAPQAKGSVKLFARNNGNNVPLKSNFYVQLPNGKNIAKKIYTSSAQFLLEPGVYRVTVRSKNRKNIVKTIRVISGKSSTEVFSLISSLPKQPQKTQQKPPQKIAQTQTIIPVLAPTKPVKPAPAKIQKPKPAESIKPRPTREINKPKPVKTNTIPTGFLSIAMQPPRKTRFIIATRSGKKIADLTSVPSANFKLDSGQYVVTAIQNNRRRSKNVRVRTGKTSRINFKAINFQAPRNSQQNIAIPMGVLRSRIINRNGQSLRGNLTVTNARGQVVARANSVTVGVFNLPPGPHTIILDYRGLKGSERVNIRPRETTIQTFTVAPNKSQPR